MNFPDILRQTMRCEWLSCYLFIVSLSQLFPCDFRCRIWFWQTVWSARVNPTAPCSTRPDKGAANRHIALHNMSRIRRHVCMKAVCIITDLTLKVRTYTNQNLKQDELKLCFNLIYVTLETKALVLLHTISQDQWRKLFRLSHNSKLIMRAFNSGNLRCQKLLLK
jgi:hypothetical protein